MWGVRSEWETHLNDQHPIPNPQGGDTQRYVFTCKICSLTFQSDEHCRREESNNPFCIFRNSHYADHMERIALSGVEDYRLSYADHVKEIDSSAAKDYSQGSSALSRTQIPKKHSKQRRRLKYSPGLASDHDSSSSGRTEQAISGWSSESSTGSQG